MDWNIFVNFSVLIKSNFDSTKNKGFLYLLDRLLIYWAANMQHDLFFLYRGSIFHVNFWKHILTKIICPQCFQNIFTTPVKQKSKMPPHVRPYFTEEQRSFMALRRISGESISNIINAFALFFPGARTPNRKTVSRLVEKIYAERTFANCHIKRSGRPQSARTQANIAALNGLLLGEMNMSVVERHTSSRRNNLNLSQSTFCRIVKLDLRLHAYKHRRVMALTARTRAMRLTMCQSLVSKPDIYFRRLLVTDEALLTLRGHVFNKQTNRVWSPSRAGIPRNFFTEASQNKEKLMVFAVMCGTGDLLPFFYEPGTKLTTTEYINKLAREVFPKLRQVLGNRMFDRMYWQQDGAPCHTANRTIRFLDQVFGHRMLAYKSLQGEDWSPSSPDLSACDFHLWARVRDIAYRPLPNTVAELKQKVTQACASIPRAEIQRAVLQIKSKAALCVQVQGEAFEGLKLWVL